MEKNNEIHEQGYVHVHQSIPVKKRRKTRSVKHIITTAAIFFCIGLVIGVSIYSIYISSKTYAINEREHVRYQTVFFSNKDAYPHKFSDGKCISCGYQKRDDGFTTKQLDQLEEITKTLSEEVLKNNKGTVYVIESNDFEDTCVPLANGKHMWILSTMDSKGENMRIIEDCTFRGGYCLYCYTEEDW